MAVIEKHLQELLIEVQAELKAPKSQRNSFGGYNYRSCEDILEAVKPLLKERGVLMVISDEVVQFTSSSSPQLVNVTDSKGKTSAEVIGGDRFYIKATVSVAKGEERVDVSGFAREADYKKGMDESQITGAASSYARKYALNGMFNIDDTKEADTDEHRKLTTRPTAKSQAMQQEMVDSVNSVMGKPTLKQISTIWALGKKAGIEDEQISARIKTLTSPKEASEAIEKLNQLVAEREG